MGTLRERKKHVTRNTIIQKGVELFGEKTFDQTTMEEIAREAFVSKATLYNYFKDKESILAAHFKKRLQENKDFLEELLRSSLPFREKFARMVDFLTSFFQENETLSSAFFSLRMQKPFSVNFQENELRSGVEGWIDKLIRQAQEKGELRRDIQASILTKNLQLLTLGYLINSYTEKTFIDFPSIKTTLISMFLDGAKGQDAL